MTSLPPAVSKNLIAEPVGTVLAFNGGQLIAGLHLQLNAMSLGTESLSNPGFSELPSEQFPITTESAMQRGCIQSLLGAIIEAQNSTKMPIWLCGGDSELLIKELDKRHLDIYHYPNLVMEGMVKLRAKNVKR